MENLLECKRRRFSAKIGLNEDRFYCEGKIQVKGNRAWLCQNMFDGDPIKDKLGFIYSWAVFNGSQLNLFGVYDFKLLGMSELTPGDKAKEVYKSFWLIEGTTPNQAKEASLITVGYIEQALSELEGYNVEYWNEVKLELGKL